jgi:myosin III
MSYLVGLSQHIEFNNLPVPTDRFELQVLIGEGTYGEVYAAKDKVSGKKVAVKVKKHVSIVANCY